MADRFNGGKPKVSLIPPEFLFALVEAFAEGEVKYGRDNWRSGGGLTWSEVYDSAQRHMLSWLSGEDIDPTSDTSHLSKAAWNLLVLEYYRRHPTLFGAMDDRYKTLEKIAYDIGNERIADTAFGQCVPENGPGWYQGLRPVRQEGEDVGGRTSVVDLPGVQGTVRGEAGDDRGGPAGGVDQDRGGEEKGDGADNCQPDGYLRRLSGCARCAGTTVLEELQAEIATWADAVFPDRTAHGALTKLMLHEIPELITSKLLDPTEYADIVILVLDIAHLNGIDISSAVREKMAINRARTWKIDPDTGLMSHVPKGKWSYVKRPESEWACANYFGWASGIGSCDNCEGRSGGCPDGQDKDAVLDAYKAHTEVGKYQYSPEAITKPNVCPEFVNITNYAADTFKSPCVICKFQPGPDGAPCQYKEDK